MNRSRTLVRLAAVVVLATPSRAAVHGQSYGTGEQVLTIGAAEFGSESLGSSGWLGGADGYLSNSGPGLSQSPTERYYRSLVLLPEGARIRKLCMYVFDTDVLNDVAVTFKIVKLVYGGQGSAEIQLGSWLSSNLAPGYRSYCQDLDQTFTAVFDVDGDQAPDPAAWYIQLRMGDLLDEGDLLGFGGVQITWTRQVSPPPATPTFEDVPASHTFHPFIEALARSGITGGCGSGNFCPDNPLTRGQMAVFLAKALGLHWSY